MVGFHSLGAPREGELSACENKGDHSHQRLHHRDHHRETHGFLKELRRLVVEAELVEPEGISTARAKPEVRGSGPSGWHRDEPQLRLIRGWSVLRWATGWLRLAPTRGGLTTMLAFYNICPIKMSYRPRQGVLPFRTWGGRRPGAGRKPAGPRAGVPHRRRPLHHGSQPVHVTLRAVRGLPSLRGARLFPALRRGLGAASAATFRVVHYSVQANHVHLLVEAEGTRALGRGCRGSASAWRRRSTADSGGGAACGRSVTTAGRCGPLGRCATASSTCC